MELYLHSPYVFIAWCLVKHRDNFKFTYTHYSFFFSLEQSRLLHKYFRIPFRIAGPVDPCLQRQRRSECSDCTVWTVPFPLMMLLSEAPCDHVCFHYGIGFGKHLATLMISP